MTSTYIRMEPQPEYPENYSIPKVRERFTAALFGRTKPHKPGDKITCPKCGGSGVDYDPVHMLAPKGDCNTCKGSGEVTVTSVTYEARECEDEFCDNGLTDDIGVAPGKVRCIKCNGTGTEHVWRVEY